MYVRVLYGYFLALSNQLLCLLNGMRIHFPIRDNKAFHGAILPQVRTWHASHSVRYTIHMSDRMSQGGPTLEQFFRRRDKTELIPDLVGKALHDEDSWHVIIDQLPKLHYDELNTILHTLTIHASTSPEEVIMQKIYTLRSLVHTEQKSDARNPVRTLKRAS
jgi:hypothetical protein